VTFASGREGRPPNLFTIVADGSGAEERLLESEEAMVPLSWSRDGRALAFRNLYGQVWMRNEDGEIDAFLTGPASDARFSANDRWIAYVSDESGRDEVFVTSYPTPGARIPISTEGGEDPVWSHDGRHLYFRNGGSLFRVAVQTDERFEASLPELVVEADVIDYDLTPNERIVAILPEGSRGWDRLHVVFDWTEELRTVVSTAR
jgi:Tol biopolymer transport system component